jgi:hypothetical protein
MVGCAFNLHLLLSIYVANSTFHALQTARIQEGDVFLALHKCMLVCDELG